MRSLFRKPNPFWWPILLVYAVSFLMPAWYERASAVYGWQAFLMGITGFFYSILVPQIYAVWLANPILWCAVLALNGHLYHKATILANVSFVLACLFPLVWHESVKLGPGYFVWLSSMAGLTVVSLACRTADEEPIRRPLLPYWSASNEALHSPHDSQRMAPADPSPRPASTAFRAD